MGKILDEEEIESDQEMQEEVLNMNKKPQKKQKIKREKLIQKAKEIETENKSNKKRIRPKKNKKNDPQNKFLQEQQLTTKNPTLFKQFMGKLQKEASAISNKRQQKLINNQRLKKKEKQKLNVQNKLKFRQLVDNIKSDIPKHKKKDNMDQTMQFNGFDDEFDRIQKQSQKELEQLKYQKAQGISNKNKNQTQNSEVKRMQQVLKFQPFRQNPLDALKTHIQNSLN
ncbi:hypothetical protein PPERSA_06224 [Pseudocohnilembus persalinus]|uniref:Ribosome biogenesis protein SLX9 n=1 Tax=Pseudocohnilembus persalinus TaxID=266149 RepID=A0A0V0R0K2_PSEPJ|nr:hypothetical protein PPERSA_06224 [Pseudocohnilembus persalinus]|eukprot:KRX08046.1 hypothetical protein PPERSA_06224 [Pseudocohnilembus persalinus]